MPPTTTAPELPQLWTRQECAEFLRVSQATVYRLTKDEGLPYCRIGGLKFIPADVQEWARSRRRGIA